LKSLQAQGNLLSSSAEQLRILDETVNKKSLSSFDSLLDKSGLFPLRPTSLEILQVNLGKVCNQTCKHCHVDAGPDRKESMSLDIINSCLNALKEGEFKTLDITGGAPEMNPHFRYLVEEAVKLGVKVLVRCNLTILVAGEKYRDLPEFYAKNKLEVISSLPYFQKKRTDSQRGEGVFDKSIQALKTLNSLGYGKQDSSLILNLVYNPAGSFLPGSQKDLEIQFKKELEKQGVYFNSLFTITNMPISRFLDYLLETGNLDDYLEKLVSSYNPQAAVNVMCRNTLSVDWEGKLFDCDFNQMLEIRVDGECRNIQNFSREKLQSRKIQTAPHCFGCTAGSGSSCGGAVA
jgi:radical SAM/Cys-rich protein